MERPPLPSPRRMFWFGLAVEAGAVLLAFVLARLLFEDPIPGGIRFDLPSLAIGVLATLPPAVYAVLATSDLGLRFRPFRGIHDKVREFLGDAISSLSWWQLGAWALAAGVGEELLFRGVLQPAVGLGWASLLFALAHLITPAYFVMAFLLGAYLGVLYHWTDNLVIPVMVHALYDAFAFALLRRRLRAERARDDGMEEPASRDEPALRDDPDEPGRGPVSGDQPGGQDNDRPASR